MYRVAVYNEIGSLIFEKEAVSHQEALELAEDLSGEYLVVIYHPDGEEEEVY